MQIRRLAWAITGSGHYLRECLDVLQAFKNQNLTPVDIFLSKAAAEIIKQYGFQTQLEASGHRVFQDKTASSIPVEFFYQGQYHTLVIAPATSNTVAKMAYGFSDSLVTNLYAQAGKTRVTSIVFACDTIPALGDAFIESEAPRENIVKVFPRQIDLDNVAKLSQFELTQVVDSIESLEESIYKRLNAVSIK
ncbi:MULTISPECIES: flavoprotein [Methylotenera]|uniref:flavoprotein n=1 Tax=Methylotenera TaxID=359407 RepID=UPI000365DFC7|nr:MULTISPECIES: flavoprotein [Methylotenera]